MVEAMAMAMAIAPACNRLRRPRLQQATSGDVC
jgi:hypothetical protein